MRDSVSGVSGTGAGTVTTAGTTTATRSAARHHHPGWWRRNIVPPGRFGTTRTGRADGPVRRAPGRRARKPFAALRVRADSMAVATPVQNQLGPEREIRTGRVLLRNGHEPNRSTASGKRSGPTSPTVSR